MAAWQDQIAPAVPTRRGVSLTNAASGLVMIGLPQQSTGPGASHQFSVSRPDRLYDVGELPSQVRGV
jgi:hypothetical protein